MLHVSCAFRLQTETTAMDMDDCDDKIIQNTDTRSNVSITNIVSVLLSSDLNLSLRYSNNLRVTSGITSVYIV